MLSSHKDKKLLQCICLSSLELALKFFPYKLLFRQCCFLLLCTLCHPLDRRQKCVTIIHKKVVQLFFKGVLYKFEKPDSHSYALFPTDKINTHGWTLFKTKSLLNYKTE